MMSWRHACRSSPPCSSSRAAGVQRRGRPPRRSPPPAESDQPEGWAPYYEAMARLGEGFVVWESFRAGHWRIWARDLDGSPERQLSPDEAGRDHVAAHISPDGRHVVYLSLPAPHRDFNPLPPGQTAPLHLVRLEGDRVAEDRVLAPDARAYDGSRVALWVSPRALIYIAGDNTTRQIDILTGVEEVLIPEPKTRYGMLVNATRTHATNGMPTFSIYHPKDRTVSRRTRLPGCEPYFTPDGRLGYWVADVGGPIRKYDLADYTTAVVIDRDSKWLPKGHGYIYYPMASADGRLLAFSASKSQHGHFDKDFDVFVAPLDPDRFEVIGTAVRYSFSPGQDRFPDVWIAGNELGLHRGEAPLRVTLSPEPGAAEAGPWSVDFGDGTPLSPELVHVYETPGPYRVSARRGARVLGGEVKVAPGTPSEGRPIRGASRGTRARGLVRRAGRREPRRRPPRIRRAGGGPGRRRHRPRPRRDARRAARRTRRTPRERCRRPGGEAERPGLRAGARRTRFLARRWRRPGVCLRHRRHRPARSGRRHRPRANVLPRGARPCSVRRLRSAPRSGRLVRGGRAPEAPVRGLSRERQLDTRSHRVAGAQADQGARAHRLPRVRREQPEPEPLPGRERRGPARPRHGQGARRSTPWSSSVSSRPACRPTCS